MHVLFVSSPGLGHINPHGPARRQVRAAIGADQAVPGPPPGFGGPNGFATLFGRVSARPMADSLSEITSAWPPDLVVHDMSELASAPIAGALGIAHVTHSWAWVLPPETYGPAGDWTADLWTARGLQPRADGGVSSISSSTPAQVARSTGVGVALPPDRRTGEEVGNAARQVLSGAGYRERAREVAARLTRMPSAEEVAPAVEALAGIREGVG